MSKNKSSSHKYWTVRASVESDTAEITLYGEVTSDRPFDWWTGEQVPGDFIVTPELRAALEPLKGKREITVKIDSAGGDLYAGIAIHNALKALPAKKIVIVEGVAMSSASVIAMAGDEIRMYPGSIIMIHGCSFYPWEPLNQEAAESYAKAMDTMNAAMANIYAEKTGLTTDEIRAMMKTETWMNDSDAIAKGFADTRISGSSPVALSLVASAAGKLALKNGRRTCAEDFKATVPARFGSVLASKEQTKQPETNTMGSKYIAKMIAFAKKRIDKAQASFKADGSVDVSEEIEDVKDLVKEIKDEIEKTDEETAEEETALQEVEKAVETLETAIEEADTEEDPAPSAEGEGTEEEKKDDDEDAEDANLVALAAAAAVKALKAAKGKSEFQAARTKETAKANGVRPNPNDGNAPNGGKDVPFARVRMAAKALKKQYIKRK